jgi:hypothetical protein
MSEQNTTLARKPVSLPGTVEELLAARRTMRVRTLNDYVDDIHLALWSNEAYRATLEAVYDEDAVEGSLAADNFTAAQMIRKYAKDNNLAYVANRKLATIVKALNVVLRRFGFSRRQRALTVGGVMVSEHNNVACSPTSSLDNGN